MKQLIKVTGVIGPTDKGYYLTSGRYFWSPDQLQKCLDTTPKNITDVLFKNELTARKFLTATKNSKWYNYTEEDKLDMNTTKFRVATLTLEVEEE